MRPRRPTVAVTLSGWQGGTAVPLETAGAGGGVPARLSQCRVPGWAFRVGVSFKRKLRDVHVLCTKSETDRDVLPLFLPLIKSGIRQPTAEGRRGLPCVTGHSAEPSGTHSATCKRFRRGPGNGLTAPQTQPFGVQHPLHRGQWAPPSHQHTAGEEWPEPQSQWGGGAHSVPPCPVEE